MIGLRVQCDFPDCGRHFEAGQHELSPVASVASVAEGVEPLLRHPRQRDTIRPRDWRPAVAFASPVVLPDGWAVGEERGIVSVLCATHAPAAS